MTIFSGPCRLYCRASQRLAEALFFASQKSLCAPAQDAKVKAGSNRAGSCSACSGDRGFPHTRSATCHAPVPQSQKSTYQSFHGTFNLLKFGRPPLSLPENFHAVHQQWRAKKADSAPSSISLFYARRHLLRNCAQIYKSRFVKK
jgi:hypothetical protein